jgi:hypothetical protein
MSAAADFLLAFTRAIATLSLYDDRHPTTMSAVEKSFERLHLALSENGPLQFSFLMNEVVCGKRAMRELSDWEWSSRLALAGVQRLEIDVGVTAEEYLGALVEIEKRLAGGNSATTLARPMRRTHIRYGAVGRPGQGRDTEDVRERAPLPTATISYSLGEEADAVRWIHGEMESSGTLALLEAEAVVRSLAVAMHGSGKIVIPLTQMKDFDQYTTTHSLNVAVLAMALAETLGFGAQDTGPSGRRGSCTTSARCVCRVISW